LCAPSDQHDLQGKRTTNERVPVRINSFFETRRHHMPVKGTIQGTLCNGLP